jgi:REP-associated tyrosine transposase
MQLSRLPRKGAYIGANRYFVTINVRERQPRFTDRQLVETCRAQVDAACKSNAFLVIADCYMPDHLHLLLEGLVGASDFRRFMKDAKQRTSFHAIRLGGGRLWQDGYHDRIVRQDEDLSAYVDYILQNPVRAGLVERAEDYPYASTRLTSLRPQRDDRVDTAGTPRAASSAGPGRLP